MANIITSIRILLSAVLLFFPVFSPAFFAVYLTSGFTDMIDGAVARKTNTVSEFGSRLDTIADIVFVAVCLIKLLPVLNIPIWLYICEYVFKNSDIIRIYAEPFAYNTASCRVLEKAGFRFEGLLRQNAIKNNKIVDMKMYALIKKQ